MLGPGPDHPRRVMLCDDDPIVVSLVKESLAKLASQFTLTFIVGNLLVQRRKSYMVLSLRPEV
jgi:hypothetical protein